MDVFTNTDYTELMQKSFGDTATATKKTPAMKLDAFSKEATVKCTEKMSKTFGRAIRKAMCCPSFVFQTINFEDEPEQNLSGIFSRQSARSRRSVSEANFYAEVGILVDMHSSTAVDPWDPNLWEKGSRAARGGLHANMAVSEEIGNTWPMLTASDRIAEHQYTVREAIAKIRASQHRTHVFVISIVGHSARLIRWDQRGALISEAFNLATHAAQLSSFLAHYEHGSLLQRGYDDSVSEATAEQISAFEEAVKGVIARAHPDLADDYEFTLDPDARTYKVLVPERDCPNAPKRSYIIRAPFIEKCPASGVRTLGYLAWGCTEKKVVFLKDTWREVVTGQLSEAGQLEKLRSLNVSHLPIVYSGGDIYDVQGSFPHRTITQLGRTSADFAELRHHRIAEELMIPLSSAQSPKQLVQIIRDVLSALKKAYEEGGIVHRDISVGNIMIGGDGSGILNDWDRAAEAVLCDQLKRVGTLQSMSIFLLDTPDKKQGIEDDVEACFWSLLKTVTLSLKWGGPFQDSILSIMNLLDDQPLEERTLGGRLVIKGGSLKLKAIEKGRFQNVEFASLPLKMVLAEFSEILATYYKTRQFSRPLVPKSDVYREWGNSKTGSRKYREQQAIFVEAKRKLTEVTEIMAIFDRALEREDWDEYDNFADAELTESNQSVLRRRQVSVESTRSVPRRANGTESDASYESGGVSSPRPRRGARYSNDLFFDRPYPSSPTPLPGKKRNRADEQEPVIHAGEKTAEEGRSTRSGAKRRKAARVCVSVEV